METVRNKLELVCDALRSNVFVFVRQIYSSEVISYVLLRSPTNG